MRRLGEVVRVVKNQYIVVKLDDPDRIPMLGVKVYDEFRRLIGKLLDIIGPVTSPYAVVKAADKTIAEYVKPGLVAYYIAPRPRREKKRGKKSGKKREGRGKSGGGRRGRRQTRPRKK